MRISHLVGIPHPLIFLGRRTNNDVVMHFLDLVYSGPSMSVETGAIEFY